ncbi:TTL-domain-containing protein [Saccharata proteae CBS 121410]|uniref:TTL-domain-containing protein n=1 Tax=Saccharata proteae CBS 121410 TaxID=1314787 RepID=A0A9P4LSY5_9PEZI|nr:TTL-domain-containing protein [Saccharata proteae CBS 121410]
MSRTPFYALVNYEDPYVQPLILSALSTRLPPSSYKLINSVSELPSPSAPLLQIRAYESLAFELALSSPTTNLMNAYVIRKALIRKHYLSTTVANWVTKHPASVLARHVKPAVEFEVDYAEFLDDALVEAWELRESWARNEGRSQSEREWWILKPGMSDRGQGIRLFSSEEELVAIFEEWEPDSSSEDEESEEEDEDEDEDEDEQKKDYIITSQLRHFIAQPYIDPPLLFNDRKFHIRTYVLAVGALQLYVYKPMLALFAAAPYTPPHATTTPPDLRAHLTNTCLQTGDREGSVRLFWDLPRTTPSNPTLPPSWQSAVFAQICAIASHTFEAAARAMSIHFQPLPSAFELFGVDFMVDAAGDAWLLEVNAFPDFRQSGPELSGLVAGLFDAVVDVAVKPFFCGGEGREGCADLVRVLDVDLGRR